jgi:HSP20 family protein
MAILHFLLNVQRLEDPFGGVLNLCQHTRDFRAEYGRRVTGSPVGLRGAFLLIWINAARPHSMQILQINHREEDQMAESATKVPAKSTEAEAGRAPVPQTLRPFESLRRELDRLFEEFEQDSWRAPFRRSAFDIEPFWRRELSWGMTPAVDIVEKENAYEISAELPGMDEKDIEVKLANGVLTIKGERQEEKEEKRRDYYLRERRLGSFERRFRAPEGVDSDKISATFKKGLLTITLPKSADAQKAVKKIDVKVT